VSAQQQQHAAAAVAFTTAGPGQEMLVHFNFNKDREGLFRPEEHPVLQRCVFVLMSWFFLYLICERMRMILYCVLRYWARTEENIRIFIQDIQSLGQHSKSRICQIQSMKSPPPMIFYGAFIWYVTYRLFGSPWSSSCLCLTLIHQKHTVRCRVCFYT
jgi:hypothetical protein